MRLFAVSMASVSLAAGIAAAVVATSSVPRVFADSTQPVTVPRGTVIPVVLTKELRVGGIGDSQVKKVTSLEVAQDVIVAGHLIAQKGDTVDGTMSAEKNATVRVFGAATSNEVALDVDDVVNFCGDTMHMRFERTERGGAKTGFGMFGGKAKDAVFPQGAVLKAVTDRVQRNVCGQRTTAQSKPLPSDILVPDEEVAQPAPH